MDSDIVSDEVLGGGVNREDVEKVGCGDMCRYRGMIVIDGTGAHGSGLEGDIGEYLTLGRSRVSSTDGAKLVETRFLEGSHFVKGRFGEFGT